LRVETSNIVKIAVATAATPIPLAILQPSGRFP
jgi:hypothetical protein